MMDRIDSVDRLVEQNKDLIKKVTELKKDKTYLQGVIKTMLRTEREVNEENRIRQWLPK